MTGTAVTRLPDHRRLQPEADLALLEAPATIASRA